MVYQHYAPRNLASSFNAKGAAAAAPMIGRSLALLYLFHNSRDTWWFRKPQEMISPTGFDTPLNPTITLSAAANC